MLMSFPVQEDLDLTTLMETLDEFAILGHLEARGGYTTKLKLARWLNQSSLY